MLYIYIHSCQIWNGENTERFCYDFVMMSCCDDSTLSAVPVWAGTMLSAIVFLKNAHYVVDAWYLDVVDKNLEQSCWWG